MSDTNQLTEFEQATTPKKNGTINVLTILTFIGCAFQLIGLFAMKWLLSFSLKVADDPERMASLTDSQREQIMRGKQFYDLYTQNQIPLTVLSLIGVALCFWGALQMRKLKKQGFYAYAVGEFVPIIGSIALIGLSVQYNSVPSILMGFGIPVLFTLLYALQLKRMK